MIPAEIDRFDRAVIQASAELETFVTKVAQQLGPAEADIFKSYKLHANCYITKPVDLEQFVQVVKSIDDFWLTVVRLPSETP